MGFDEGMQIHTCFPKTSLTSTFPHAKQKYSTFELWDSLVLLGLEICQGLRVVKLREPEDVPSTPTTLISTNSHNVHKKSTSCSPSLQEKPMSQGAIEDDGSLTLVGMASDNVTIHRVLLGIIGLIHCPGFKQRVSLVVDFKRWPDKVGVQILQTFLIQHRMSLISVFGVPVATRNALGSRRFLVLQACEAQKAAVKRNPLTAPAHALGHLPQARQRARADTNRSGAQHGYHNGPIKAARSAASGCHVLCYTVAWTFQLPRSLSSCRLWPGWPKLLYRMTERMQFQEKTSSKRLVTFCCAYLPRYTTHESLP